MPPELYRPTDRRPLASRQRPFWQKTASVLASAHVSPNGISLAGMACAIGAGIGLALTGRVPQPWPRILFLAAALGAQLRLIANLLDGMVAIASGRASRVGELFNEIPDRVSDAAFFIGAGYAAGGQAVAGFVAACLAIMTAYVRAVGKAAGVSNLYQGPMAKQHRMFVMTLVCVYLALSPASWQPAWKGCGLIAAALWVIAAGALITCARRTHRIACVLRSSKERP